MRHFKNTFEYEIVVNLKPPELCIVNTDFQGFHIPIKTSMWQSRDLEIIELIDLPG